MGCDADNGVVVRYGKFQSTHPVWDATATTCTATIAYKDFNPRIPYGMRPLVGLKVMLSRNFNPRIPYGMRQSGVNKWTKAVSISIHASRMGCDMRRHPAPFGCRNFNPRIPYGMRRVRHVRFQGAVISIHASRMGCDVMFPRILRPLLISIHASRMGCDKYARSRCWCCANFNPRIPYGMRPFALIFMFLCRNFNPRIPYGMRLPSYAVQYRSN